MLFIILSFLASSVVSTLNIYFTIKIVEEMRELRLCANDFPSGGYYQRFPLARYIAAKYLRSRCEILIEELPQGGYNVYPFSWELKQKLRK